MRKLIITALFVLFLLPAVGSAQSDWTFVNVWPPDTSATQGGHGLAIDDAGKVWVGAYWSRQWITDDGDTVARTPIDVHHNPGGQPADFAPIYEFYHGENDTLRPGYVTGMNTDNEGNILIALHGERNYAGTLDASVAYILRVDPYTGELLGYNRDDITIEREPGTAHAPNRPVATDDGYIIVSFVWGSGTPILILNQELELFATPVEEKSGFSRTLEASSDGEFIYHPGYDQGYLTIYQGDIFGDYEIVDTTMAHGMVPGAVVLDPTDSNILWLAADGGGWDPGSTAEWNNNAFYAFDLTTKEVVDSIIVEVGGFPRPRASAFSPDGDRFFVGRFDSGTMAALQYARPGTSVEQKDDFIASGYELSQNYPNPFNPTTQIDFTINESAMTTLTVYDVLGREVKTLINEHLTAGGYTVTFDATNLPSGTYLYVLESAGQRLMKRMVLIK